MVTCADCWYCNRGFWGCLNRNWHKWRCRAFVVKPATTGHRVTGKGAQKVTHGLCKHANADGLCEIYFPISEYARYGERGAALAKRNALGGAVDRRTIQAEQAEKDGVWPDSYVIVGNGKYSPNPSSMDEPGEPSTWPEGEPQALPTEPPKGK